jgi:hypothetical protein
MPRVPRPELLHVSRGGSYLCEGYELRVTERCLGEDLSHSTQRPFDDLASHEAISKFVADCRDSRSDGGRLVRFESRTRVRLLPYRAATWHDEDHAVVWLVAYTDGPGAGEEGQNEFLGRLDRERRLLPSTADYEALYGDDDARFTETLRGKANRLLTLAHDQPGEEQHAQFPPGLEVGLTVVFTYDDIGSIYVTLKTKLPARTTFKHMTILQAALFPDRDPDDIEQVESVPYRELGRDEIAICLPGLAY